MITESSKRRFLRQLDDRFLELLRLDTTEMAPAFRAFVECNPRVTPTTLARLARKKLHYSKNTGDEDIFQALVNSYRRMRKAA